MDPNSLWRNHFWFLDLLFLILLFVFLDDKINEEIPELTSKWKKFNIFPDIYQNGGDEIENSSWSIELSYHRSFIN